MNHREEFEKFYAKELGFSVLSDVFTKEGEGYLYGHTQRAWLCWCEGAKHQAPPVPEGMVLIPEEELEALREDLRYQQIISNAAQAEIIKRNKAAQENNDD